MRSIRQSICWTGVFIVVLPNLNHYILSTFIYQSWEKIKLWTKIFQLQEVFAPWHFSKIYEEINMDIKFRGTGELSLIFLMLSLLRQIDIWSWNIVTCCSVPHHGWPDIRVVPRGGHAARGGAHPAAPARAHRQHHRGLHHLLQHGWAQPRA